MNKIHFSFIVLVFSSSLFVACSSSSQIPSQRTRLLTVSYYGKYLYLYDVVSTTASEKIKSLNPRNELFDNYFAYQDSTGWNVGFGKFNNDNMSFDLAYELHYSKQFKFLEHNEFVNPKPDNGIYFSMYLAYHRANKEFFRGNTLYNSSVLKQNDSIFAVYFIPVQVDPNNYLLGGDVRYIINVKSDSIIDFASLHRRPKEFPKSSTVNNNRVLVKPGSGKPILYDVYSNYVYDIPVETDVYFMFLRQPTVPFYVATNKELFKINITGEIIKLERDGYIINY